MPLTTHQKRLLKAYAAENLGIQAIGVRLGIPRGEVALALEAMRHVNRRFASPDFPGVPQLTDDEADLAAHPANMTDLDERIMTARIASITKGIREHKGEWSDEVSYA